MSDSVLEVRRVSKKFFLSKESAYRPKLAAIARSFLGIKLDEKIGADEFLRLHIAEHGTLVALVDN